MPAATLKDRIPGYSAVAAVTDMAKSAARNDQKGGPSAPCEPHNADNI
jgi:hypothetical protein